MVGTLAVGVVFATMPMSYADGSPGHTIVVRPGQSIQAAVNEAAPGTTILIKPGTYHQSVTVTTNRLTLRGFGDETVIAPPKTLPNNLCTQISGGSGICVLGQINAQTGAVIKPVFGVTIVDLTVKNFPGDGVFGFGTSKLTVHEVAAWNNSSYGIARFVSSGGSITESKATGGGEAGIYVGDSPNAHALVADNVVWNNGFGLFVRHSHFVTVRDNTSFANCQGVFVLDDGQPGGVGNIKVVDNIVKNNNKFCPANPEEHAPPLQGGGILLLGAQHSLVINNGVFGNQGAQINSGGIVLLSAQMFGGNVPNFNVIVNNEAFKNLPADIRWDGTGKGNIFRNNECKTSSPNGLCFRN
jgi:hypothetical protein